jgi:hypothetical protein
VAAKDPTFALRAKMGHPQKRALALSVETAWCGSPELVDDRSTGHPTAAGGVCANRTEPRDSSRLPDRVGTRTRRSSPGLKATAGRPAFVPQDGGNCVLQGLKPILSVIVYVGAKAPTS